MIHILVGAAVGVVAGVLGYAVAAGIRHKPLTWKGALASGAAGLVGGVVTAATLGAGGLASATTTEAVIAGELGGVTSGALEQTANDLLDRKTPGFDVVASAAVAGVTGAAFGGADKLVVPAVEEAAQPLIETAVHAGLVRVGLASAQKTERKLTEAAIKSRLTPQASPGIVGSLERVNAPGTEGR